MDAMKAAGKEYEWDQITIEGLWIFDHGNGYGADSINRSHPRFKELWGAMGKALDENHGQGAVIHHRGCDMATDYGGTGSEITAAAVASGHSVTGSVGFVQWYYDEEAGLPDYGGLPDYYSEGGYKIAIPLGNNGNYTVLDYTNTHISNMNGLPSPWTSNTIVW